MWEVRLGKGERRVGRGRGNWGVTRRAARYAAEALEERRLLSTITGFSNFTLNAADGLGTNGSATTDNNQGAAPVILNPAQLELTSASANQASSAWYAAPVSYQNFTASFSYYETNGTIPPGTGVAMVLQNDARGLHAIGGGGGDLGYSTGSSHPAVAIANSVAIEFDAFDGSLNGIARGGGGMIDGQQTKPVNLGDGYTINVILSYNSASQTLSEMLTDTITGVSYSTSFANLNLPALLGGSTAYIGFTGGTAANYAEQYVFSFNFATHASAAPLPGSVVGFSGFTLNGANGAGIDDSAPQDNNNGASPTLSADQNTLTLTTAAANQASSAFTPTTLPYHNFTASFTYQQSGSTSPGNGFAFVLQNDYRGANVLGGGGEELGYGTDANHPGVVIGSSFAVEFNVFQVSSTAIGTYGSTSGLPTLGGNTGNVDLRSGDPVHITLSYNDSTLIETLTDTKTLATYTTSYAGVNLPSALVYRAAHVGFTGGTGGAVALQSISDFAFTPYSSVPPAPPPPVPINGFANFTLNTFYATPPAVSAGGNTLTLTAAQTAQSSSAIFNAAVPFQNFTASFTYQESGSSSPADGFTFLLENDPRDVDAVGGTGGQLGYGTDANNRATPISPSFAAEFNIYRTSSVSADVNGNVSIPHNLFNTGPVNLASGDPIAITLSYNSVTNTLYETLIDAPANARYAVAFTNINLPAILGGSTAYIGFTGGTGGAFAAQTVSNFTFMASATVPPVPALPAPVNSLSGFSTFDQNGLSTNPAGAPTVGPTALTLTTAAYNEAATAFSNTPVTYGDFSANFHYTNTAGGATPADGFTFSLQQTPSLGRIGGNLGYATNLPDSLAVEFNVYQGSSVSIGAGGSISVPNGITNTGSVNLASGDSIYVSIWYTGSSQTLNVNLFDLSTSNSYTASFPNLDLSRILGSPAAYVGFTGGTGGGFSQQVITAFSYSASAPQPIVPGPQVSLSGYFNAYGIGNPGSPAIDEGYDGSGESLVESYFGPSQTIAINGTSQTFDFGPAGAPDLIDADGQTINLPPGNYANLSLVGGAAYGSQLNQPFTVTYSDGTTQTFTQGFSDWYIPTTLPGQSIAIPMTNWLLSTGAESQPGVQLAVYAYSFALDPTRIAQSITLPNDTQVKILAMNVNPLPAITAVTPASGPAAGGTTVTIAGSGFAGATAVDFGATPATSFTVNAAGTQITAVDPAGSGTVDVTVTGPGGTSAISPADPFTYISSLPAWLAAGSIATWNLSTHTLTVTGAATIIADPGADEPNIVASGSAAQLAITPATSPTDVHVGNISLSSGAGITVTSVASRSHSNHNVLVIGPAGAANDPTVSIDSTSKLDLGSNDLIVHTGTSDATGASELTAWRALAQTGRGVPAGSVLDGTWTGNGLTSSAAAATDKSAGYEETVLAVIRNNDQILGSDTKWTVGTASEAVGAKDIIVKYTYNGDAAMEGFVGDDSVTIVNGLYDGGKSSQPDWAFGDFTGSGGVNDDDITILNGLYGNGTAGSGLPQL